MEEKHDLSSGVDLPLDMLVHLAAYCHLPTIGKLHCCTTRTKSVWRSFHIIYYDELAPFQRFSEEHADLILDARLEQTLYAHAHWIDQVYLPKTARLTPRLCLKWGPHLKSLSILTTAREFPHLIPLLDPQRLEYVHIRLDINANIRSLEPLRALFASKQFPRLADLSVAVLDRKVLDSFIESTGHLQNLILDLSIMFLNESDVPEVLEKIRAIVRANPRLASLAVQGHLFSLDSRVFPNMPLDQQPHQWHTLRRRIPDEFGVPMSALRPSAESSASSFRSSVWAYCFEKFLWYSIYDRDEDIIPLPPVAMCAALFEDCLPSLADRVMALAEVFLPREITTGVDKAPLMEYPEDYYFWIETTIRKLVADALELGFEARYYAVVAAATLYSLLCYHRRDSRGALILLRHVLDRDPQFSLAYLYYCMKPFGNLFIDIYAPLMEGLSWQALQERGISTMLEEILRWTRAVHILTLHDDIPVNFRLNDGSLLLPKLFFYHTTLPMLRKLATLKRLYPNETIPTFSFNMSLIDLLNDQEAIVLFAPICQSWNDILGNDGHKFVSFAHILLDITRIQVGLQHCKEENPDVAKFLQFQLSPELEDAILNSLDKLAQKTARRTQPGAGGWLFGPS